MKIERIFDGDPDDEDDDELIHTTSVFTAAIPGCGGVQILDDPTYNCQMFIIGGADSLLNADRKTRIKGFRDIVNKVGKPMFMLDVEEEYERKIDDMFRKENIVMKQAYESTNGSDMFIYLIKTHDMIKPERKKVKK